MSYKALHNDNSDGISNNNYCMVSVYGCHGNILIVISIIIIIIDDFSPSLKKPRYT